MEGEFYHKDIFGSVVDLNLSVDDEISDAVKAASADKGFFDTFAFTDALAERKKKDAWVLYQKALASGLVAEQLFYRAMWMMKTLLTVMRTKSAEEAGMKTFPYNKAKGFLRNWKEGEIEKLSQELVEGYHKARRGEGEIETMLEKVLLSL